MKNIPNKTILCDLFYKYGADKCPQIHHTYSPEYYEVLNVFKEDFRNIIEIGIGSQQIMNSIVGERYNVGASILAWRDFFINANIYGLDILKEVLFEDDRIKCFYTDQSNDVALEYTIYEIRKHKQNENLLFDMIIDDGSHNIDHQILSFNTLFKYLNVGGLYIIEDIKLHNVNTIINLGNGVGKIIKTHIGHANETDDAFVIIQK